MGRPPAWAFALVIGAYFVLIPFAGLPITAGQTPFEIMVGLVILAALFGIVWATPALEEREDRKDPP